MGINKYIFVIVALMFISFNGHSQSVALSYKSCSKVVFIDLDSIKLFTDSLAVEKYCATIKGVELREIYREKILLKSDSVNKDTVFISGELIDLSNKSRRWQVILLDELIHYVLKNNLASLKWSNGEYIRSVEMKTKGSKRKGYKAICFFDVNKNKEFYRKVEYVIADKNGW